MTTTAAKWAERVREWRASGKTAEEFAADLDFESTTLRYWASRLKTEGMARRAPALARVVRKEQGTASTMVTSAMPADLEIAVGVARIVVRRGFDPELLREVIAALGSGR